MQRTIKYPKKWHGFILEFAKMRGISGPHRAIIELIAIGLRQYGFDAQMPPERGKYERPSRFERIEKL